jgi:hypothetical protein
MHKIIQELEFVKVQAQRLNLPSSPLEHIPLYYDSLRKKIKIWRDIEVDTVMRRSDSELVRLLREEEDLLEYVQLKEQNLLAPCVVYMDSNYTAETGEAKIPSLVVDFAKHKSDPWLFTQTGGGRLYVSTSTKLVSYIIDTRLGQLYKENQVDVNSPVQLLCVYNGFLFGVEKRDTRQFIVKYKGDSLTVDTERICKIPETNFCTTMVGKELLIGGEHLQNWTLDTVVCGFFSPRLNGWVSEEIDFHVDIITADNVNIVAVSNKTKAITIWQWPHYMFNCKWSIPHKEHIHSAVLVNEVLFLSTERSIEVWCTEKKEKVKSLQLVKDKVSEACVERVNLTKLNDIMFMASADIYKPVVFAVLNENSIPQNPRSPNRIEPARVHNLIQIPIRPSPTITLFQRDLGGVFKESDCRGIIQVQDDILVDQYNDNIRVWNLCSGGKFEKK